MVAVRKVFFNYQTCILYMKIVFETIEKEIGRKNESLFSPLEVLEKVFLSLCEQKFSKKEVLSIQDLFKFLHEIKIKSTYYPSIILYLNHPIRIAEYALNMQEVPDLTTIKIALMHNIFEISDLTRQDLEGRGFSKEVLNALELFPVDRVRQYDLDYLKDYYARFENFGPNVSLIKCLDKIDNLFGLLHVEKDEKRIKYVDMSMKFIGPMAYKLSEDFENYFMDLANKVRDVECDTELKDRYETFRKSKINFLPNETKQ